MQLIDDPIPHSLSPVEKKSTYLYLPNIEHIARMSILVVRSSILLTRVKKRQQN